MKIETKLEFILILEKHALHPKNLNREELKNAFMQIYVKWLKKSKIGHRQLKKIRNAHMLISFHIIMKPKILILKIKKRVLIKNNG